MFVGVRGWLKGCCDFLAQPNRDTFGSNRITQQRERNWTTDCDKDSE